MYSYYPIFVSDIIFDIHFIVILSQNEIKNNIIVMEKVLFVDTSLYTERCAFDASYYAYVQNRTNLTVLTKRGTYNYF